MAFTSPRFPVWLASAVLVSALTVAAAARSPQAAPGPFDLIVAGGRIVDGTGAA